ncbi:hypothetical protein PABG_11726 [Paracoccidioides brasiliensis Pb03]|nr:hypothetical protein PABG_11726 [Paracoccidioides brasiliensis Pb03]
MSGVEALVGAWRHNIENVRQCGKIHFALDMVPAQRS